MRSATWFRRAGWLGVFGIAVLSTGSLRADDEPKGDAGPKPVEGPPPGQERPTPKDAGPHIRRESRDEVKRVRPHDRGVIDDFREGVRGIRRHAPSKYRLDMHVAPLPEALDKQLDLKGQGALVEDVAPDGPAAKAGILAFDIVSAIGEHPIKDLDDLFKAVDESEGKELSIKLIRAGKPVTVSITPVKNEGPAAGRGPFGGLTPGKGVDVSEIERVIRDKLKSAGGDLRLEFFQPGKIFPPGTLLASEFPEDLTVNIHKQGKGPAEVEVKQGDKTWNVKEGDLSALPDELRPHVEAILGRPFRIHLAAPFGPGGPEAPDRPRRPPGPPHEGPDGPDARRPPGPPREGGPDGPGVRRPPGPPHGEPGGPDGPGGPPEVRGRRGPGSLEQRLSEMTRELDRMRDQLERMRKGLSEDRDDN